MRFGLALFLSLVVAGCASTSSVDMSEPRRVLGRESDVRIDAQIFGDVVTSGALIRITYEIENLRATPILVADLIPESHYDPESGTITVHIGSEVPGNEIVPRLLRIEPRESESFSTAARLNLVLPPNAPPFRVPRALRLRLNFLNQTEPFEELIEIPEKVVASAELANRLFPVWVESNESVTTNALPVRWRGPEPAPAPPSRRR